MPRFDFEEPEEFADKVQRNGELNKSLFPDIGIKVVDKYQKGVQKIENEPVDVIYATAFIFLTADGIGPKDREEYYYFEEEVPEAICRNQEDEAKFQARIKKRVDEITGILQEHVAGSEIFAGRVLPLKGV